MSAKLSWPSSRRLFLAQLQQLGHQRRVVHLGLAELADTAARAGAVTAPVVVVVGEHESAEARAAADALAAAVANGRVVTLAGAGRRGVIEQPAALAAIVAGAAEGVPA